MKQTTSTRRYLAPVLLTLTLASQPPGPVRAGECCDIPGDATHSGTVNIGDVTYLISHIFTGGPAPFCDGEGDPDGNGGINIGDVTYLIARIFSGGPEPICPPPGAAPPDTATYQLTFTSDWSAETHPDNFPANPHFSGLIGSTHDSAVVFWEEGALASEGVRFVAEFGYKPVLSDEIKAAIQAGTANSEISGGGIGPSPGSVALQFSVNSDFPLVSLISMVAPSPDWIVGVNSLPLWSDSAWVDSVDVTLYAYDVGTDDGATYTAPNNPADPHQPIAIITTSPFLVDTTVTPVGSFRFVKQ